MNACNLPSLVARVLVSRGMADPYDVQCYLSATLEKDWEDPMCIPGMREVAARVISAIDNKETIVVFGDYDVDGITATSLMCDALAELGVSAIPFIPHRTNEGYGLTIPALTRLLSHHTPDLILTVDNGIAASAEVEWLHSRGIDVAITDHHEPSHLVPQIEEVCDPKLDVSCPSADLAGVGVALKLVSVLGEHFGKPHLWKSYLELCCLGTLADMMELSQENRALVTAGIEQLHYTQRPGLLSLARVAGIDIHSTTSEDLPFSLIPRINAAGRLDKTELAYELLNAKHMRNALVLAQELEDVNTLRKEYEKTATIEAEHLASQTSSARSIVVASHACPEGVKGIVAARLVRKFHVPCIVCSLEDGVAKGSGRTSGSIDLFHATEAASASLTRFGGHSGAVGITCDEDRLDTFRHDLEAYMQTLPEDAFFDTEEITARVSLNEITVQTLDALELMQPFGKGNARPLFVAQQVHLAHKKRVGKEGEHLRFTAVQHGTRIDGIMFRVEDIEAWMEDTSLVDIVFSALNETWQGRIRPKLMVRAIMHHLEDHLIAPHGVQASLVEDGASTSLHTNTLCAGDCDACSYARFAPELLVKASSCEPVVQNSDILPARKVYTPHETPFTHLDEHTLGASVRTKLACMSREEIQTFVMQHLIGASALLPAQERALDLLYEGESALCVMPTGRGKSLIFQLFALVEAISSHKMSVFVYPLRALVNDQQYHVRDICEHLGVTARVLCGETPASEREECEQAVRAGKVDILLTTPEFLSLHTDMFLNAAFVVFDEAHHMANAKAGSRTAYLDIPRVLHKLGDPCVLAVSATVDDACAREICHLTNILPEHVIVDEFTRTNLDVVDMRFERHRRDMLVSLVSHEQKTIVYVNSRSCAQELVSMLRHKLPHLAYMIAFYHAGLSRTQRQQVEEAFRTNQVFCIVATSAFGEGINIQDVRDVILYHMPFSYTDLNQMSGRCGRDGKPSSIYMLYTQDDALSNELILSCAQPTREQIGVVYQALHSICERSETAFPHMCDITQDTWHIQVDVETILADIRAHRSVGAIPYACVEASLCILADTGLIHYETHITSEPMVIESHVDAQKDTVYHKIYDLSMSKRPNPVMLEKSLRYIEGLHMWEAWQYFSSWAQTATQQELLAYINQPIYPAVGEHIRMNA